MPNLFSSSHKEPEPEILEEDKMLAIMAYVPFLCLVPFLRRDRSSFVSSHVYLGMSLFVIEIFAVILRFLPAVWDLILFLCVVGAIAGILHVVRGRPFTLPYLSDWLTRRP